MPLPNEHRARQTSPDKYVRFRRENNKFGSGIDAIWGITKAGKVELQSVAFDKKKYTSAQASEWLKKHKMKTSVEAAKNEQANNAVWSTAYVNDLPDSAFLFISPGGKKESGKTVPRSLRHFPYKDANGKVDLPHLRNALARIPQANIPASAKKAATAKAKKLLDSANRNENMSLQHITRNFRPTVRYDKMEGKQFLVVPSIPIVEGVHNGSNGPLLYPADELAKTPQVWNTKPVVVYHPEINGRGVSACDPVILDSRKVGEMMNTIYEDGKLKTEVWLDEQACNRIDKRILNSVRNGEIMELSTGLFTDNDLVDGEWQGEPYSAIARNYRPDHLALLPDKIGACSIEDGAGFLRVNAEVENETDELIIGDNFADDFYPFLEAAGIDTNKLKANELSHGGIRDQLYTVLRKKKPDAFIEAVYDDRFIYADNGRLYMQEYTEKKSVIKTIGIPQEVVRVVEYRTATGTVIGNSHKELLQKGVLMDKDKLIDDIIKNHQTNFSEDDRSYLESQELEVLQKFVPKAPEKPAVTTNTEVKPEKNKDEVNANEQKPVTLDEYVSNAPPEIRGPILNMKQNYEADCTRLRNVIMANARNQFTEDQLKGKNLDELNMIARLAAPDEKLKPTYDGNGEVNTNNITENVGELPIAKPVMTAPVEKK